MEHNKNMGFGTSAIHSGVTREAGMPCHVHTGIHHLPEQTGSMTAHLTVLPASSCKACRKQRVRAMSLQE